MRSLPWSVGTVERVNIELLKLAGAAAMLYEHCWRYVVHSFPWHVQLAGRIVFPCFVLALAQGLRFAPQATVLASARRMALWGLAAAAGSMAVRGTPSNVLFTFAAGVYLHACLFGFVRARWASVIGVVALGFGCEGGIAWVVAVTLALTAARTHRPYLQLAAAGGSWALIAIGQYYIAAGVVGVAVALLIATVPLQVPRIPRLFYWVYVVQWPLIAALRAVL